MSLRGEHYKQQAGSIMEVEQCNKGTPGVQGMRVILPEPMLIIALLQYRQDKPTCCQAWAKPHRLMLGGIPYI